MADARDRLIVALDVPSSADARALVGRLGETVTFYKIGLELLFGGGLDLARQLKAEGKRVFLDLKILDISSTVEKAVANAAGLDVDFLTIHGVDRKTLSAAAKGRAGSGLKLLAVTVMTHLDRSDLAEQGIDSAPVDLVVKRARMARDCGIDGVIASGAEAASVRTACGPAFLIVTPGIRPAGSAAGDQTRIMTPAEAIRAGADHLVIGRPITGAGGPKDAAEGILIEIASANRGS